MTISIVEAKPDHILELRENLRPEDEKEITCLGLCVKKVLWRTFKASIFSKTALIEGKVAAIWGVGGNALGNVGKPWLLTSPISKTVPIAFAFIYRNQVRDMLKIFPVLENWVHNDYTESVRLLKIIGFQLDEPEPIGKNGALFRRYYMQEQKQELEKSLGA